jgi:hypothetical protein
LNKIIKQFLKLKLLIIINIIFCNIFINNAFGSENFVVTTVNKIPITKNDIVNRAKLISFSIEKNTDFKKLQNYYNQALNSLINEKIILSAGLKINNNIIKIVTPKANQILLNEFDNSEDKLNKFINYLSIPKAKLLEKYESQLVWGIVLKNKFKDQLLKLDNIVQNDIEDQKNRKTEDLYDVAEIVISKNNNQNLLNQIKSALKSGVNFLDLAKQVSISSSAKFRGKVGWKNYRNLPRYIKSKKINLNEGDIISFPTKDKIKIIKILAKRLNGKFSENETSVILGQIKFPINFQKKDVAYKKVKYAVKDLLTNKKSCKNLNIIKNQNTNYSVNIIKSRIADISTKIQNVIKNFELYKISQPIFLGNYGYTYIICDFKKPKSEKKTILDLKNKMMQKHYLIISERYLKRLNKEAIITHKKKLNK